MTCLNIFSRFMSFNIMLLNMLINIIQLERAEADAEARDCDRFKSRGEDFLPRMYTVPLM